MEKAVLQHNNRTGTTASYAGEIDDDFKSKKTKAQVLSDQKNRQGMSHAADCAFLDGWTKGLRIMGQHPDDLCKDSASKLPKLPNANLALFITGNILSGSMFKHMHKALGGKFTRPSLELKSRLESLSRQYQKDLYTFVKEAQRV